MRPLQPAGEIWLAAKVFLAGCKECMHGSAAERCMSPFEPAGEALLWLAQKGTGVKEVGGVGGWVQGLMDTLSQGHHPLLQ